MSTQGPQVEAQEVVAILRRRLENEMWNTVVLEAQCNEMAGQLAESANDKMTIRQLELRIEELEGAAAS